MFERIHKGQTIYLKKRQNTEIYWRRCLLWKRSVEFYV